LSLRFALGEILLDAHNKKFPMTVKSWQVLPPSSAKPQPNCVPEVLQQDYYEACAIRHLSPKASATLIRRCIQGCIRHFCGITKARLLDEIKELKRRVDAGQVPTGVQADTVDALDAVRQIGNIGAHMERDIDVIVDVDPGEAQTLIELVEMLFEEWYVARETRNQRIAAISGIAAAKKAIQVSKSRRTCHRPRVCRLPRETTSSRFGALLRER
jgi:Domain of unknown function (DUF4145)